MKGEKRRMPPAELGKIKYQHSNLESESSAVLLNVSEIF
jgi:hypothetical protein